MSIVSEAEEDKVNERHFWWKTFCQPSNGLLVFLSRSDEILILAFHPENMIGLNVERLKQRGVSHCEIAFGIVRRGAAFVSKQKVDAGPIKSPFPLRCCKDVIEGFRCGSS